MMLSLIISFTAVAQEAYAVYTNDGTLTFYYDNQRGSRTGTKYAMNTGHYNPGWIYDHRKDIKKAIFTPSFANARPISTFEWFHVDYSEESVLTEIIGLEYLDTSEVTDMYGMFWNSSNLTNLDLSHFNTSKVTNMDQMFAGCKSLTSIDVSHFKTNNVTTMWGMFDGCSGLTNLDVTKFVTGNVTDMNAMFRNCSNLTELDLSCFNTSLTTDMRFMFSGCNNLTTIYAGEGWNTEKVTKSTYMFSGCINLVGGAGTTYDVNHTDKEYARIDGGVSNPGYFTDKTAHAENEAYAVYTTDGTLTFYYDNQKSSRSGTKYNLNSDSRYPVWKSNDIKKVVFNSSFSNARPTTTFGWFCSDSNSNLSEILGLEYLNTSEVTNMGYMFGHCKKLTSIDLSHFDTSKVTTMGQMFFGCNGLTSLDLTSFNTSNVTFMRSMFLGCDGLTTLDLTSFNTDKLDDTLGMFLGCSRLTTIFVVDGWHTDFVTYSSRMFEDCTSLVGGAGTTYDANHVDKAYAHIDGGPSNPGYLTYKKAAPKEVCDADDLLRFIESLNGNTTTNDNPAEATLCDEPTIDQDVDIEDDLWLYLYGDDDITPPVMNFYGGAINLKSRNSGWTFKGVGFTCKDGATAPMRAAGNPGGITSMGTLTFDGCTLKEGNYAVQNLSDGRMYLSGGTVVERHGNLISSGNVYIDGSVKVADLVNKKGGRIYLTSALTEDIKVSITTTADVEQGVAIILGGNGYTMTAADVSHITLTLPDGFEWKYNEAAGGIVVNSAAGISALEQQKVIVEDYDILGRKVSKNIKGLHIQQMNDGTVKKVITN